MKRNSIQNRILSFLLGCSMAAASIDALPYSSLPVYADTEETTAGETENKTAETEESETDKQNSDGQNLDDQNLDGRNSDEQNSNKKDSDEESSKEQKSGPQNGDSTEKEGDENPTEMGGSSAIKPISEGGADGSTSGTGSEGKSGKASDSTAQDKGTQKSRYHAVLVYSSGNNDLGNVPQKDAEAMKTMLCKTDQFSEADITTISISYTERYSSDPTQQIWDKLDAIAEETDENSVTLFFYVGHGGKSNADDICYLDVSSVKREYNITAIELKSKLSKLKGSVMMILSACNSGGMLVQGIAEDEETDEETETIWSTQDEADEFAEDFQLQFLTGDETASVSMAEEGDGEGDQTTGTSSGPVYYAFTSATKVETAIELPNIGSELVASLGNALGYDRNATGYQIYAADTETSSSGEKRSGYAGDGQITMAELASYVKRTSMTSTPVIYPDTNNQTVLFTYAEDEGTPAEFYAEISQEPEWDSTNKAYRITTTVHNLTNQTIYLRGSVYTFNNRIYGLTALNPDNELFREKYYDTENEVDNEEEDPYDSDLVVTSIESGETRNITRILADSDEDIYNKANDRSFNPLCLKLWECDEDGKSFSKGYSSYSYSGFYVKGNGNQSSGNVSKDALQYKYPTQFASGQGFLIGGKTTAAVTNVSNLVPIEIQYDTETGTVADTKLSAADCTLSMEALDLGTEETAAQLNVYVESTTESDGKTSDHLYYNKNFYETYAAELEELEALTGSKTIFTGVQPDRSRNGEKFLRGSTYYYAMDTSWMQMDHYYVLDVTCTYSDKSEKHIYALVKKTSAEDAVYEIPKLEYSDSYSGDFAAYFGGIPVGENWNNSYANRSCQVKDVTKQMESFLNNSGMGLYTNTIVGWDKPISGGWMRLNDTDTFEVGMEYRCYIEISIKEGYNAAFTEKTEFSFGAHSIVEKSISKDGKKATICLSHTASSLAEISAEDLVTLTYVGGSNDGKEVGEEKLKVGDLITIEPGNSDLDIVDRQGLTYVKNIEKDGTKYSVYEVVGLEPAESSEDSDSSTGHIEISVRNKHAGECHCMTLLYIHDVDLNEGVRTVGKISITKSDLQLYMTANGGMPTGDTWESGSITGLSGKVKDNKAAKYLSTLPASRQYGISWEVRRWTYRNEGIDDTRCPEDKEFENGRTVRSYLTLSLPKESRFQFVPDKSKTYHTEVEIDNHQVEIYSTTSGKTLNIVVNHIIPEELNEEAAGLKMYRVKDTGEVDTEVITESDTLQIGDRVVVGVNNGYEYYVMRGLTDTGEVTAIGEKIYEVTESTNKETSEKREFGGIEIVITMPPKDAKAAETNCGCGTLLYKHAIQYSSSLTITKDDLQSYITKGGGIPIGATWKSSNSGLDGTVGKNWLLNTLNSLDKFSQKGITYSDLKWTKDNKEQGSGNYFSSGSITSTMTVTLSDEWAMEFASSEGSSASGQKANTIYYSEVEIDGHQVKMEINSSNPKKATVSVTHVIPSELNEASAGLKLKWVDGENAGKEVLETQKLQIGDRVTIKVNEGYEYHISGGLEATDETTADGEVIYKVKEARNKATGKRGGVEILITMPPKDTEDEGTNCGCGTLLYKRTIDYSEKDTETITVTKEQLANYMAKKGGIPVGDTWKSGSITGFETVGTNQLAEYLESLDFFKKRSIEFTGLTWVNGSTESTLADDDNFTNGTVKSKMTVVLPDGDLEFAKKLPESSDTDSSTHYYTGIEIDGHKVEVTIKNSKEAEITVTHSIPKELNEKDANLTLCWAEGDHAGEEISADTALEIGQTVTIDLASGYQCYPLMGLTDTGRKTKEGKIIYQVAQSVNTNGQYGGVEIVITMPRTDGEDEKTNCGCGTLLYKYDIKYSSTINISKENLQNYITKNAGIPVGDTWKEKGINQTLNGTVGSNRLQSYWNSGQSPFYEWGIQCSGLTWKDSSGNTLAGSSYFSNGTTVTSSITFTLPSDRAIEFATQDDTSAHDANTIYYSGVTVAGHETTTSVVAGDSKKATVAVKHIIPEALNEKDAGVQLRWADGEHAGEVISKDTTVEVGQKVTVDINDGYEYRVVYGLEETGEVSDGKKIYKVIAKQSGDTLLLGVALLITMPTTDEKTNCGCGTLLYMHDATNSTSGDAWYYPDTSKDPETITITRGEMENYHALTSSGEMDGGIPVGDVWKEGSTTGVQGTVGANRFADYLNSLDFFKKRAIQFTDLTWIDGESGEELGENSYFNYGTVKSTLLMELPFGSDLEFSRESKDSSDEASGTHYYTGFEIEGHKVEMTILDNKTAKITIEHQIPDSLNATDAGVKLYRVKNREIAEEIGTDTALQIGEYVAIELDEAYKYEVISGLQDTGKKTSDGRKIYVVANYKTGNYGGVELLLSMPQTDYNADMNCGCGTVLYKHSIARSAGDGGSSRGTGWRTFYSRGSGSYSTMFYGGRETLIQNYVLTENMMQYYRVSAGGIPVGDNWTTGSLSKLSSKTEDNLLTMFMDSMAGGSFNHSVIWSKYDAATGQETVMSGTDIFRQGEQYVSTITISVAKGYRMVFSSATHFGFSGHELLGEPVISADGKSATVKVLHTIPQMDENAVKLYLADTGEEVTSETVLQPGDRVRIVMAGGYGYHILCGLQYSGEDDIFIVEYGQNGDGEIGGIEIMAFLNGTLNLDGCLCGTLLYKHAVGTVSYSQVLGADRKAAENAGLVTLAVANGTTISRDGAVAETGDDGELLRWLLLGLGSAAGLVGTGALRRRRSRRRRP